MKKETLIAIILGISAGVVIAFFLVLQSSTTPRNNDVIIDEITPTVSVDTTGIEPLLIQAPDNNFVTDKDTIEIKASAPKNSMVVIQSLLSEYVIDNASGNFTQTLDLAPGENQFKITSYNEGSIDSRSLTVYSISSSLGNTSSKDDSADDTSNSASTNNEDEESTIETLKNKIEEKVDELSKSSRNIAAGIVKEIDDSTVTIESHEGDEVSVSLDSTITEVFEVSLTEKEESDIDTIEEGDFVVVSGPSIENQISANTIYIQDEYVVSYGQITSVDSDAFQIEVTTHEKDTYTIDIEDDTNQSILDSSTLKVVKAGFSKLKEGDTIHIVVSKPDEEGVAAAIRTFIIPQEHFAVETPSPSIDDTNLDDETDQEVSN